MDRLTKIIQDGPIKALALCNGRHGEVTIWRDYRDSKPQAVGDAVLRLSAYEDTGLTPTEISDLVTERDAALRKATAAVRDMILIATDEQPCTVCSKANCHLWNTGKCDFQWRGPCEDNQRGPEPGAMADTRKRGPEIVCLCGPTRFYDTFQQANYELTMQGKIVLTVGFYPHSQEQAHGQEIGCTPEQKIALDELHKRKIDLADKVLVLNVGGYIGDSTRSEIEYAKAHGKPVCYLVGPEPGGEESK